MSDAPEAPKQAPEAPTPQAGVVAEHPAPTGTAQGLIHNILHEQERSLQAKDVHKQQDLAMHAEQKHHRRVERGDDPMHGKKGLMIAKQSWNAQRGSHGLSGQGPK